ncbi:DUF1573 domain-containing protein [Polaribacter huanghezhanensis]|uniref:DUF1573 domain-containing protein n=1 Tax=Polaribacter huanghezhanensis TaxID=1354726 RepID=UPI002647A1AC|nr:DUF1573 domain-containing protein [Polaribacter huanghezhanensis]
MNNNTSQIFTFKTNISFNSDLNNFGEIKQDSKANYYFVYENIGAKNFIINDVKSSCGCTIPIWSKKELLPGNKDSILVSYNTSKPGYFSKEVLIFSNSVNSPSTLYVKGTVIPKKN